MINLTKVKSSDLWYIVGYIATDGYLSSDGRHINITSKDRKHLYLIRNALLLENKIGRKVRSNELKKKYSQLQFGDVNFYKYLEKIGLTSRKSFWVHKSNHNSQWCLRLFSASPVFTIYSQKW